MKQQFLFGILFFQSIFSFAQGTNARGTGKISAHNTYAVVVGISKYESKGLHPLHYAHKDAEAFADYLQSAAGGSVPAENIKILLNENATVAAVYDALAWLQRTCEKDDLVFFYFAGHGDMESQTIFNLGFLLTYNTPRTNYINNALRIEDLNNIANTLSVTNNANVVLITDACHSGDLAGSGFRGSFLVGDALRRVKNNEIRITSCAPNQLSAEDMGWGGGRGVFSYYLINGLEGLADRDPDGIVTVKEIRQFLDSALSNDPILAQNKLVQNPVLTGNENFKLSAVDTKTLVVLKGQMKQNFNNIAPAVKPIEPPQEYLFRILQDSLFSPEWYGKNIEQVVDFVQLNKISKDEIPFVFISMLANSLANTAIDVEKIRSVAQIIKGDKTMLRRFNDQLVELIHNRGQDIINLYLEGDEAELEKRRYYSAFSTGYDVYPQMFALAQKLLSPDDNQYLYKILQVDEHYFAGVAARLKIPVSIDPHPLLEKDMTEQLLALHLEPNAAYIQNELGILFMAKKDIANAEKYFVRATELAPQWAVPQANLCGLYAFNKKPDKAIAAGQIADSLQNDLPLTKIYLGETYETLNNWLFSEENYRKAIELNSRHYSPFERLGYVYTNTTQYAAADSFFYEASLRKAGYNFFPTEYDERRFGIGPQPEREFDCSVDTANLLINDVMAFFSWGESEYKMFDYQKAENIFKRIISIDSNDPLVYHYLGKIYIDEGKWEEAEVMFKLAIEKHLDSLSFAKHCQALTDNKYNYDHSCIEEFYKEAWYEKEADLYLLASVYESWAHYQEAQNCYQQIILLKPDFIGGYCKLWRLQEKLGSYLETENTIKNCSASNRETSDKELSFFYRRMIDKDPDNGNWPYKLGLLFYEKAASPAYYDMIDTVVYFPLLKKEVFIGLDEMDKLGNDSSYYLDANTAPGKIGISRLGEKDTYVQLPGIAIPEKVATGPIYTPRKDAVTWLLKATDHITDSSTLADVYTKIGNVYSWAGSKKMAYPYFDKSIQFSPGNAGARLNMIDACHTLFRNRAALENLEYLYQNNQINFSNRMLLAEFYILGGQYKKGTQLLDDAVNIYPNAIPAITDLVGRMNLLSGKTRMAIPYYKNYLTYHPDDSSTMYTLARLYAKSGDAIEAWDWLEKAMSKGFDLKFVLQYDPAWDKYRNQNKWKQLQKKYPRIKKYGPA